jgi:hypothetical protein
MVLFALAQNSAALHIGQAFQASSPKNFHGLAFAPALFLISLTAGSWLAQLWLAV